MPTILLTKHTAKTKENKYKKNMGVKGFPIDS